MHHHSSARRYRTALLILLIPLLALTSAPAPTARASSKFDFAANGLPQPRSAYYNGATGYSTLLDRIRANANATWATTSLLRGEREFRARGGVLKRYLTTAWIWFENGSSGWPDPYEINCRNSSTYSQVSLLCGSSNFQIAGYQAYTRRHDYLKMYRKFYGDSSLQTVMKRVVDNSYRAIRAAWRYKDSGQQKGLVSTYLPRLSTATVADISPNSGFFTNRGQFFTLIVGKDPYVAVALNSYAVSDGDLVRALKYYRCAYGYICSREKQLLSNMVAALIIYETGSL